MRVGSSQMGLNMNVLVQAAADFEGWAPLIYLAVFALMAVAKPLIEYFGGKKEGDEDKEEGESKQVPKSPRHKPDRPVARAMPIRHAADPHNHERRVARAVPFPPTQPAPHAQVPPRSRSKTPVPPSPKPVEPQRSVMEEILEEALPEIARELKSQITAHQRPPTPAPRSRQDQPGRPAPRPKPARKIRKRPPSETTASTPEEHLKKLDHLKANVGDAPASRAKRSKQPEPSIDSIHHPTRSSLRRAIIMNEILGAPIALRGEPPRF